MKVVIDIDENVFTRLFDNGTEDHEIAKDDLSTIVQSIRKGTPLPKGHGKLGDLDALREEVSSWGMNDYEPLDFIDEIDSADTIIPADKTESEDDKECGK